MLLILERSKNNNFAADPSFQYLVRERRLHQRGFWTKS
jgi:hypothetical protein